MHQSLSRSLLSLAFAAGMSSLASPTRAQSLSEEAKALFNVTDFATGLSNPTDVGFLPDGRVLVTIKGGADTETAGLPGGFVVYSKAGTKEKTFAGVFPQASANHAGGEQGVLGLVVDPNFATNHLVYVFSAAGPSDGDKMQVDAYALDGTAPDFTVTKKHTLVSMLIHGHRNHVGGGMDIHQGMLYIGVGDGGYVGYSRPGGNDTIVDPTFDNPTPKNNLPQCLNWGNGKILRIKLDGSIPMDAADPNPLVSSATATTCSDLTNNQTKASPFVMGAPSKLVWAWGLRNPYRIWVDPLTGHVWAGDVGDTTVEEIDIVEKGKNYGWPFFEGMKQRSSEANWEANFPADAAKKTCTDLTPPQPCVAPALAWEHGDSFGGFTPDETGGSAVIGGLIPPTANWPDTYRKKYIFGDFAQKVVFTVDVNDGHTAADSATAKVFLSDFAPSGFRMSPDGILFIVSHGGASVFTVVPKSGPLVQPEPSGGNGGGGAGSAGDAASGAGGGGGTSSPGGGNTGAVSAGSNGSGAGGGTSNAVPPSSTKVSSGCACRAQGGERNSGWKVFPLALLLCARRSRRASLRPKPALLLLPQET